MGKRQIGGGTPKAWKTRNDENKLKFGYSSIRIKRQSFPAEPETSGKQRKRKNLILRNL